MYKQHGFCPLFTAVPSDNWKGHFPGLHELCRGTAVRFGRMETKGWYYPHIHQTSGVRSKEEDCFYLVSLHTTASQIHEAIYPHPVRKTCCNGMNRGKLCLLHDSRIAPAGLHPETLKFQFIYIYTQINYKNFGNCYFVLVAYWIMLDWQQ